MFQTISGILGVFFILLPKKLPVDKKASWNSETKMGNHIEVIPMILPPMETPIESRDNAIARNIDSLASILLELSKSECSGPWKIIHNPIIHKIIPPTKLHEKLEKKLDIAFPTSKEKEVIESEKINKISFAQLEILVFFKPYVIPVPRESILKHSANII